MMTMRQSYIEVCPDCGVSDVLSEAAVDADGQPTGELLLTCATCGRTLGGLPPPAPAAEAESELEPMEEPAPAEGT
jgi:hypothetical protein